MYQIKSNGWACLGVCSIVAAQPGACGMGIKMKSPPAADQTKASESKKLFFYNSLIEFFHRGQQSLTQQLLKRYSSVRMRSLQTMRCHGKVSQ